MTAALLIWLSVPGSDPIAWRAELPAGLRASGAGSCAASGCHGGNEFRGTTGSEFSTWAAVDPHARAYAVLFDDRSLRMIERLRGKVALATERDYHTALEAENCLACHATTAKADSPILADGVGCEACHGPSERYRSTHYLSGWKAKSAAAKCADGLAPLADAARRAVTCARCHVGGPGMDVNHDLIAAGHPRLAFEFASHLARYPKHWKEPADEARDWVIGQAAAGRAAAALLEARAAKAKPWPELAEFGCYSCHHELTGQPSWRQNRPAGQLGTPTAGEWNSLDALAKFGRELTPGVDWKPDVVARLKQCVAMATPDQAKAVAAEWKRGMETALDELSKPGAVRGDAVPAFTRRLANDGLRADAFTDWESAAQHYLALAALTRSDGVTPLRRPLMFEVKLPRRYDSPRRFSREEYAQLLRELLPQLGGRP